MTVPSAGRFGLSCALATPLAPDGAIDVDRLAAHALACRAAGCASVTVFGTTGEGASFAMAQRERALASLCAVGLDPGTRIVAGIAACAVEEARAQARQAAAFGVRTLLLAPPYYFKDCTDEGLARWFSAVLDTVAREGQRAILYHIPSVTSVPLSLALIGRLREAFPSVVAGVKDSSGDWDHAQRLLAAHGDLAILVGDERLLAAAVRLGGQGAISGVANFAAEWLVPAVDAGREDARVVPLVDAILRLPVIPAVKALLAHATGDSAWQAVAPPLMPLARDAAAGLCATYDALRSQPRVPA